MTPDQDLSAATADMAKSKPEPHWPVGLYAPGMYTCVCADCGKQHVAAKRALHCADCTIQRLFNRIVSDREKMDVMATDHTAAVQAAVAEAVEAERARTHAERMKLDSRIRNQRRELAFWGYCFTSQVWGVLRGKGIVSDDDRKRVTKLWLDREARRTAAIRSRGVEG